MLRSDVLRGRRGHFGGNPQVPDPVLSEQVFDAAARRSQLGLMLRLEESLQASLRALLALDLAAIERRTREQVLLSAELSALLKRAASAEAKSTFALGDRENSDEWKRVQAGIFRALRLQTAVLKRAQLKLRVMSNMLADPGAAYSRPSASMESAAGPGSERLITR